jgi:membrane-associated phospholipid phosphatase
MLSQCSGHRLRLLRFLIPILLTSLPVAVFAQLVPEQNSTQPGRNLASLSSADRCILLTPAMCDGLLATSQDSEPNAPQTSSNSGRTHQLLVRFAHDQAGLYAAPFKPSNLPWDAVFFVGTAALIATDKNTIGPVSNQHIDLNRNISNAGIYGMGAAAGAIWVTGLVTHDPHAQETGFLTAEALANAVPIYVGLQLIAGRERPNEGVGHGRFLQNHSINSSFPSGHALFAWTMASVIAHEYPRRWVKILVYGTATVVSVTRFTGREHFVSDVAVGSFLGYFLGRHIFHAHCSTEFSEACH